MKNKVTVLKKNNKFLVKETPKFSPLLQKDFGEKNSDGIVELSLLETLYLLMKDKIKLFDTKEQEISYQELLEKSTKFSFKEYQVYKDLRNKGHRVKSGMKYGFTFRVYEKGTEKDQHSRWLIEVVEDRKKELYKNIAAKNRIAHSTRKEAIFAIVDDESSIVYINTMWKKL